MYAMQRFNFFSLTNFRFYPDITNDQTLDIVMIGNITVIVSQQQEAALTVLKCLRWCLTWKESRSSHTQTSCFVWESDFVIQAQITLLQREIVEMEVDQFAFRHLNVPLALGCVAVGARVTHRGQSATSTSQLLWSPTAWCYIEKTERENWHYTLTLSHIVTVGKWSMFKELDSYCAHCRGLGGWHLLSTGCRQKRGWTQKASYP